MRMNHWLGGSSNSRLVAGRLGTGKKATTRVDCRHTKGNRKYTDELIAHVKWMLACGESPKHIKQVTGLTCNYIGQVKNEFVRASVKAKMLTPDELTRNLPSPTIHNHDQSTSTQENRPAAAAAATNHAVREAADPNRDQAVQATHSSWAYGGWNAGTEPNHQQGATVTSTNRLYPITVLAELGGGYNTTDLQKKLARAGINPAYQVNGKKQTRCFYDERAIEYVRTNPTVKSVMNRIVAGKSKEQSSSPLERKLDRALVLMETIVKELGVEVADK